LQLFLIHFHKLIHSALYVKKEWNKNIVILRLSWQEQ
jgi:hypothetical protein